LNNLEEAQEKVDTLINNGPIVEYVCLSDVESKPVDWLWHKRIAFGKVSLLSGDPGLGKSLITLDLAGRITTGNNWPVDNSPSKKGSVIFLNAEDEVDDTIKPRLETIGADVSKVFVITSVKDFDKNNRVIDRSVSLKSDINRIEEIINTIPDCRMVVIDPITAYMEGTDSYKNSEVRTFLAPIKSLAEKTGVAVLLVSHLNKSTGHNAINRISGSGALPALCRAVYNVSKDEDDEDTRYFIPVKNNLGVDRGAFTYQIVSADNDMPVVEWGESIIDLTADEAMGATHGESKSAVDEAADFLEQELSNGSMKVIDLKERAKQNDITPASLKRAKKLKGVVADREGGRDGYWYWHFPDGYFNNDKGDHKDALHTTLNPLSALNPFNETQADKVFKGDQHFKEAQEAQDIVCIEEQELKALLDTILDDIGRPITAESVLGELVPGDYQSFIDDPVYARDYITKTLLPRLEA